MEFMIGICVGGMIMTATMMLSMAKAAKIGDEWECQIIQKERKSK